MKECTVCGAYGLRPGPCQPWCSGVTLWLRSLPPPGSPIRRELSRRSLAEEA